MDQQSKPLPSQVVSSPPPSFPIVGIGASAGGLEAFKGLLSHLEDETSMAYVFVQHLAPTHESLLPESADLLAASVSGENTAPLSLGPQVSRLSAAGNLRNSGRKP